jgi:hypothetical protein
VRRADEQVKNRTSSSPSGLYWRVRFRRAAIARQAESQAIPARFFIEEQRKQTQLGIELPRIHFLITIQHLHALDFQAEQPHVTDDEAIQTNNLQSRNNFR